MGIVIRNAIANFMTRYGTSRDETAWLLDMENDGDLFDRVMDGTVRKLPRERLAKLVRLGVPPENMFPVAGSVEALLIMSYGYYIGTPEAYFDHAWNVFQEILENNDCEPGEHAKCFFRPETLQDAMDGKQVHKDMMPAITAVGTEYGALMSRKEWVEEMLADYHERQEKEQIREKQKHPGPHREPEQIQPAGTESLSSRIRQLEAELALTRKARDVADNEKKELERTVREQTEKIHRLEYQKNIAKDREKLPDRENKDMEISRLKNRIALLERNVPEVVKAQMYDGELDLFLTDAIEDYVRKNPGRVRRGQLLRGFLEDYITTDVEQARKNLTGFRAEIQKRPDCMQDGGSVGPFRIKTKNGGKHTKVYVDGIDGGFLTAAVTPSDTKDSYNMAAEFMRIFT